MPKQLVLGDKFDKRTNPAALSKWWVYRREGFGFPGIGLHQLRHTFLSLAAEQMAKARACKSPEDVLELAKEEGYELSDEELSGISGGDWSCWTVCVQQCSPYNICPHDIYD